MKINDVLECYNAALDNERIHRELNVKGHFVSTMEIKKSMGPYKQAFINIIYIDIDHKTNRQFVSSSWMERALIDDINKFTETAEKQALIKFIIACNENDVWKKVIEGKYGIE